MGFVMSEMNVKLATVIIGGCAVIGAGAVYAGVIAPESHINVAKSTIRSTTAPPSTPTIAVAVPAITGKAPLFAGQDPNTNPAA